MFLRGLAVSRNFDYLRKLWNSVTTRHCAEYVSSLAERQSDIRRAFVCQRNFLLKPIPARNFSELPVLSSRPVVFQRMLIFTGFARVFQVVPLEVSRLRDFATDKFDCHSRNLRTTSWAEALAWECSPTRTTSRRNFLFRQENRLSSFFRDAPFLRLFSSFYCTEHRTTMFRRQPVEYVYMYMYIRWTLYDFRDSMFSKACRLVKHFKT